jgi:hypothetical protein
MRAVWAIARADFLERARRHSFLVSLAFTLYVGYSVITGDVVLLLDDWRGVYNSAWVGALMALVITMLLSLIGFYLVKSAVERDRRSGVGEILAATPMSRFEYTLGKTLSNAAVLASQVLVLAASAIVMQLIAGEDRHVDAVALLLPILLVAIPAMTLTAALAVFFECVPLLRGGLGNVAWFFLWSTMMGASAATAMSGRHAWFDGSGFALLAPRLMQAGREHIPGYHGGLSLTIGTLSAHHVFLWDGMRWTWSLVLERLLWLPIAVAIAALGAAVFDRFDRSPARRARGDEPEGEASAAATPLPEPEIALTPLPPRAVGHGLLALVFAELRLMLRGVPPIWSIVALGLAVLCWAIPLPAARAVVLPIAWIWPLLVWSTLGARERLHGTDAIVFSAPRPLSGPFLSTWIAGVTLAVALGAGVGVRLLASGDVAGWFGWMAGALFVPSLALALGVWSGNGRLFEALYLIVWYIGPLHRVPALDFIGVGPPTIAAGMPAVFFALAIALLAAAVVGRRRQIRG